MNKILQSEVNVIFNTMFKMNCSVESYPPVMAIYWEEDGIQLNDNLEIRMDTKVLEEVTVDTSNRGAIITYTCVAVNVINGVNHTANNSIDVIIQGKTIHLIIFIAYLLVVSKKKFGRFHGHSIIATLTSKCIPLTSCFTLISSNTTKYNKHYSVFEMPYCTI